MSKINQPPKTVTTTAELTPVSPLAISKCLTKCGGTQFPTWPGSELGPIITICHEDSSNSQDEEITMAQRSFSPTNGIETLILAAADSMKDSCSDESTSHASFHETDHDLRSVSSASTNGRKLRNWQESFQALVRYKEQHGNCSVPVRYPPDSALANWVRYQQRKQDTLPLDRLQQLESIGFCFGHRNDHTWEHKFQRMEEWISQHGNTSNISNDDELSQWVSTQRAQYKKGLLRADRREKLNSIGFVWNANQKRISSEDYNGGATQSRRDAAWNTKFKKLQEFHREHGHFRVPNRNEKDYSLGIWVSNQRAMYNRGQLAEKRVAQLNSIGFEWKLDAKEARSRIYQAQWEEQLENLIQYKRIHGHCNVPSNYAPKGLGVWVSVQKDGGRKGTISPVRAEKLMAAGLHWKEERETWWNKSFVQLQGYLAAKDCGTEVPFEEIFDHDNKLGNWIVLQGLVKKYGMLPPHRVKLLENIGVKFQGAKIVVPQSCEGAHFLGEVAAPFIPFVPELVPSLPALAIKKAKTAKHAKPRPEVIDLCSSPIVPRRRSPVAIGQAGMKRHMSIMRSTSRRGSDPPGDPPGKRAKTTIGANVPIPMVVRSSDPPGAAPCQVLSTFTI